MRYLLAGPEEECVRYNDAMMMMVMMNIDMDRTWPLILRDEDLDGGLVVYWRYL